MSFSHHTYMDSDNLFLSLLAMAGYGSPNQNVDMH